MKTSERIVELQKYSYTFFAFLKSYFTFITSLELPLESVAQFKHFNETFEQFNEEFCNQYSNTLRECYEDIIVGEETVEMITNPEYLKEKRKELRRHG